LVFLPTISFVFSLCVICQEGFTGRSPSWEGTRNGEMCHRHISLHRGFGRAKRDGWCSCRPSLLFFSLRYMPRRLHRSFAFLGRDPQWRNVPPAHFTPSRLRACQNSRHPFGWRLFCFVLSKGLEPHLTSSYRPWPDC